MSLKVILTFFSNFSSTKMTTVTVGNSIQQQ